MSKDAILHRDDGTRDSPDQDSPWAHWVSASKTRNWCNDDPVLDWLDEYGAQKGFVRDDKAPGYDARTDFLKFVFAKGNSFEEAVLAHLARSHALLRIARAPGDARKLALAEQTWQAMANGTELISQAVLWNPETRTYGAADLLVRSDVLARLFPDAFSNEDPAVPAPDIPGARWHYGVVDIKFTTLHLLKDGHAASDHRPYMAQVWLYNAALGRIQGLTPRCAYLLGRGWKQLEERGNSALDRLEPVAHAHGFGKKDVTLGELALAACDWVRRVRAEGATWSVLPEPTVDELRPNMRYTEDAPWHRAKQQIASQLEDLTLLPRVTPQHRSDAMAAGLRRWTDPRCTAPRLGISGDTYVPQVNGVIEANHSPATGPIVFPRRVEQNPELWRAPKPPEFFVDFETVTDLDDDFSAFPKKGGQPLIFMVGCGHLSNPADPKTWTFKCFTVNQLTASEEARIITDWLDHMRAVCLQQGTVLADARLFHWSPAETSNLTNAYNAAAVRHGSPSWDNLPWCDLLKNVIKAQPVTVRGAFGFGLKAIAKAMHAAGLITTLWGDGPTDGLGAMVGAWWCAHEAARLGVSVQSLELMKSIQAYNEVDCKVMFEVLHYLRTNR